MRGPAERRLAGQGLVKGRARGCRRRTADRDRRDRPAPARGSCRRACPTTTPSRVSTAGGSEARARPKSAILDAAGGRVEQDVARLDVAVDQARGVRGGQAIGHLGGDLGRLAGREPALVADPLGECRAVEELHHEVGRAVGRVGDGVDPDDVVVDDLRRRPRLADEPGSAFSSARPGRRTFSATVRSSTSSYPRTTIPIPPRPTTASTRYGPSRPNSPGRAGGPSRAEISSAGSTARSPGSAPAQLIAQPADTSRASPGPSIDGDREEASVRVQARNSGSSDRRSRATRHESHSARWPRNSAESWVPARKPAMASAGGHRVIARPPSGGMVARGAGGQGEVLGQDDDLLAEPCAGSATSPGRPSRSTAPARRPSRSRSSRRATRSRTPARSGARSRDGPVRGPSSGRGPGTRRPRPDRSPARLVPRPRRRRPIGPAFWKCRATFERTTAPSQSRNRPRSAR